MKEHLKKKKFLNLPKYPGGSAAFKEFIRTNLQYPKEALEAKAEGFVIVGYDILDTGEVINPHILKGMGHGCDEEALRLISLLRFEKVKNRGLRVRTSTKTKINFRLPGITINYSYTEPKHKQSPSIKYSYTLNS